MATKLASSRNGSRKTAPEEVSQIPQAMPVATNGESMRTIILPSVQDRWSMPIIRRYTPTLLQNLLFNRNDRLANILQLFGLMEETWPRLARNAHDMRSSPQRLSWSVAPFAEPGKAPSAKAIEKKEFIQGMIHGMKGNPLYNQAGFYGTLYSMMDAYFKGVSVMEMDWVRGDDYSYRLAGTRWIQPNFYDFPYGSGMVDRLMLVPDGGLSSKQEDFPTGKFIVATYSVKCGTRSTDGALYRPLAPWWLRMNFAVEWIMQYAQLFGLPIRWATFSPGAVNERDNLVDMMEKMAGRG